jgi:hypothetical protein
MTEQRNKKILIYQNKMVLVTKKIFNQKTISQHLGLNARSQPPKAFMYMFGEGA